MSKPSNKTMIAKRGDREIWSKVIPTPDGGSHAVFYRQHWVTVGGKRFLSPDDTPFTTPEAAWEWLHQD